MNWFGRTGIVVWCMLLSSSLLVGQESAPERYDWQMLKGKVKRGEPLTAAEQGFFDNNRPAIGATGAETAGKTTTPKSATGKAATGSPTTGGPGKVDHTAGDNVDAPAPKGPISFRYSEADYPFFIEEVEGNRSVPSPNPIIYRKPKGDGPFPAVCFLPGGSGTEKTVTIDEFKHAFAKTTRTDFLGKGYVTVGIYVKSYGRAPQSPVPHEECMLAVQRVKNLPFVDPDSIVLFGGSGGGNVSLGAASISRDLACIVVGEPATVLMAGMMRTKKAVNDPGFAETASDPMANISPENMNHLNELLSKIDCPILMVHSDEHWIKHINFEVIVPILEKAGKDITVKKYAGFPHGFYWSESQVADDADAFIRQHIKVMPKGL